MKTYPVGKFYCLSAFIALFISLSALGQVVRTVCSSGCGYSTIQAAINAANSGDTILNAGSMLWQEKRDAGILQVDVSQLAAGIYQVVVDGKSYPVVIK